VLRLQPFAGWDVVRDHHGSRENEESRANDGAFSRFALLQAGLDQISQGFTVIDAELRLIGWNLAFFRLLDFPIHMARVGTPFEDFMRFNAERGEYGPGSVEEQVASRVAAARLLKPHYLERTRPTGIILGIRGEPLPNGGFVTTYTDITVQRKQEQLIRGQNEELDRRVQERTTELENANAQLRRAYSEQKRAEVALVQAQKMEAVGKLTGGLAHDFNNLLTVIIGNLVGLRDRRRSGSTEFIDPALNAAKRGAILIQRLLAFARQQPLAEEIVNVPKAIDNLMPLLRRVVPEAIEILITRNTPNGYVRVDPNQLDNALLNLVVNARDAMPDGGRLTVSYETRSVEQHEAATLQIPTGRFLQLQLIDTGIGMDPETIARAFEPFFTRKEFGVGSGLGLSMVYAFVRQSGGSIRIDSSVGCGTTFTILLPAVDLFGVIEQAPTEGPGFVELKEHALVLLVEDDREVRRVIRRQLQGLNCMVLESSSGFEGLSLLESSPDISILMTDIVMPGTMGGIALAQRAADLRPDLAIVLMSGYVEASEKLSADCPNWPVLQKPFSSEDIVRAISARW